MSWEFEHAAPVIGSITEGNAWTGEKMLYSNIAMNRIMSLDVKTGLVEVFREDTQGTNGLNFDSEGRLFGCSGDGRAIVRFDPNGQMVVVADRVDGRRINSPNDLAITPSGSIYFSDRVGDVSPDNGISYSAIISAEPQDDGTYKTVRRTFDSSMPNGLLFSADYKTLYVAQSDYRASEDRHLRAYPVNDDGSLGEYELLHDFGPHRGIDGMTLSSEGNIVACTGWELSGPGGMITVFDPKGRIIETHPTPAQRPTNCTFVGEDLYVSSIEGHCLVARNTGMTGHLLWPN
ncbi:SMP-30/gluconolactonase/LRE family protein [Candidatus Lucifugimonas marina]|uniref:SMP-30/gluconolactonase/LRE family protein n=1 Tax=Candidatus Lucifugimonas marina TaxID=3038979 RepID=A0AAJ5ZD76_9CHLR|nr:SMP-30/gluconolactonase/LRE family protein [SAR202 cluster bacterium JH702]MDG0868499.1 SMP-30/gluconolactonase/LRE family protein [SAR202 cluster bacterium JH639]WFG35132.1 SMP-30/gluconolactonase/LRE family protein [SAR202 cluster bacterium JH545]WFG39088.1 SMP-30/gluconolactonase/LRE family protein [SAR202 cluster bacterium JH1073]